MKHRWIAFPALVVVAGLVALVAPARANCFEGCQDTCRDLSGHITSDECVDTCSRQYCEQPKRLTVSYGAIAYSADSNAAGWAYDQPDESAAKRVALSNCKQHGEGCELVVSFSNSCAAVAASASGHFATGQANTSEQAQAKAINACAGWFGRKCAIQAWSCAFP